MTNKQLKQFEELFAKKIKDASIGGVAKGYKAALDTIYNMIKDGKNLEEVSDWISSMRDKTDKVKEVIDKRD